LRLRVCVSFEPQHHLSHKKNTKNNCYFQIISIVKMCCYLTNQNTKPNMNNSSSRLEDPTKLSKRRRVSFKETCTVQVVEPRSSLNEEDRKKMWYKPNEIEEFHTEARTLSRKLRALGDDGADSAYRGLELRVSIERQKRKYMSIQCVVMAQKRFSDPRQLAGLSCRCSQWAAQAARTEAQRDFILAHTEVNDTTELPQLPALAAFPLPLKQGRASAKKRCIAESPREAERCVRRRTASPACC
jgi:hypothetical protein